MSLPTEVKDVVLDRPHSFIIISIMIIINVAILEVGSMHFFKEDPLQLFLKDANQHLEKVMSYV